MIDGKSLLRDLQKLVTVLEEDLRERCEQVAELDESLRAEWQSARDAKRTAEAYVVWRDSFLTQAAVAWGLGTVFVRFLEDNDLLDKPRLSGPGDRRQRARDQRTLFFQKNPTLSDREYLESVFRQMLALPAVAGLFDERHNPLWRAGLSGDGATKLLEFWQRVDPDTGAIAHDFTDADWDTRFLGDLYQDLSEAVRKRYALLQTPEFVEEFILDRTLTPAIEEFGWRDVRLIDPACGSGHFLLGAFTRLYDLWVTNEPGTSPRDLAQRALNQVAGVDVNPYAVAIASFRLLLVTVKSSGIRRLADAPAFGMNVVCGDSLLHGPNFSGTSGPTTDLHKRDALRHVYDTEDRDELARVLGRRYHAVVGNPPYITVKDKALNQAYRDRYGTCHRKYSLAVPFMERFFELARRGEEERWAGFVGIIMANSFMKREFGKKLIEEYMPRWDLTHVVDTSGAYIPGHGTPTVILLGRSQRPVAGTIRSVLGIQGEPSTPNNPALGKVWAAIVAQVDQPGSQSEFVSVADTDRRKFCSHPWNIGGGGAAELKELLQAAARTTLGQIAESIGPGAILNEDDAFGARPASPRLRALPEDVCRPLVEGEFVRDWGLGYETKVLFPYSSTITLRDDPLVHHWLWRVRAVLEGRKDFSTRTYKQCDRPYWEYHQIPVERNRTPLSIAFAFVATHNHFVFDRGGKVFSRTAPVIKLPPKATEEDHLILLGLLNSSLACFWLKQVSHCKGATSDSGVLQADPEKLRFEFDATKLKSFPVPSLTAEQRTHIIDLAKALNRAGEELGLGSFSPVVDRANASDCRLRDTINSVIEERKHLRCRMVRAQEELDWLIYECFGLLRDEGRLSLIWSHDVDELPPLERDGRPYRNLGGEHRALIEDIDSKRVMLATRDPNIALVECPEFKRRWHQSAGSYDERELSDEILFPRLQEEWLSSRLESSGLLRKNPALCTVAQLADEIRKDDDFMRVAEVYRGRPDSDVTVLLSELVESESVPFVSVLRYTPSGMKKRRAWEETWALQRSEDAGENVGDIRVPPKYKSGDFSNQVWWRLRGKLDVPNERFILYPHCQREADPTPVIGWAGWDSLQQAQALSSYYVRMKDQEGWSAQRLTPLLTGLLELEPWLLQWHNEIHPEYGVGMGDYFRDFVREEARSLGLTVEEIASWVPPSQGVRRRKRKTA